MEDKPSDKEDTHQSTDQSRFTMKFLKCCTLTINKPMIPLKIALFGYYGAGSFMPSFTTLLYKQRGVSLAELSTMTMFAPISQILGTTLSGVVSDKLGRTKPALVANMILTMIFVIGMLLLPEIDHKLTDPFKVTTSCNTTGFGQLLLESKCDSVAGFKNQNCSIICSGSFTTTLNENKRNLSFSIPMNNESYWNQTDGSCFYSIDPLFNERTDLPLCEHVLQVECTVCCPTDLGLKCSEKSDTGNILLMAYAAIYILFLTTYSSAYRCFDMTVMGLVKEYNSDFGHERFFSILGNMAISPFAGIIAQATTPEGGEQNYAATLYFYIGIISILFLIVYYIPVVTTSPGEKLWKKSFKLFKNIDVLMFLIVIFTLGTSFNFTKYFTGWYLEGLNASSILIGLITSVSALYGLPILITSKWWIKKLGTHLIFILSFLAYAACAVGYSCLGNPWLSLLLELHGAVTYYLLWVAVIEHSNKIAPEGLTATVIGLAGAIHYSAGKTSSGLLGGVVMNEFGAVVAFRLLAIICLSVAVLYTVYRFLRSKYLEKKIQVNKTGKPQEESKSPVVFILSDKA